MKRYIYTLLLASLVLMLSAQNCLFAQGGSRYSLAVLNLSGDSGNLSNSDLKRVTAELTREISNTGMFFTMSEMDMQTKLLNNGVDPDLGCADVGCATRAGSALGVQLVVFGEVRQTRPGYTISAKMMHVGSGEIVKSKVGSINGGLRNVIGEMRPFAQDFMGAGSSGVSSPTNDNSAREPYRSQSYEKSGGSKWLYVGLGALVAGGIGAGVLFLTGDDGGSGSSNNGNTGTPGPTGNLGGPPTFP